MRVTATGPEAVTAFTEYDLIVNKNCFYMVVTKSVVVDQFYKVNGALGSYEVNAFANDEPVYCPLTYSIIYDTSQTFMTKVDDRKMQW